MDSSKRDNQLNIALDVSDKTREQTIDLEVGFNREDQTWELIVKYSGSLDRIREELNASVVELMNEYAIITIPETEVDVLSQYEEIEFIEKPKRLFFSVIDGIAVSCLLPLQEQRQRMSGEESRIPLQNFRQGQLQVENQQQLESKESIQVGRDSLSGQGVIVAVIDSGERVIIMSS